MSIGGFRCPCRDRLYVTVRDALAIHLLKKVTVAELVQINLEKNSRVRACVNKHTCTSSPQHELDCKI